MPQSDDLVFVSNGRSEDGVQTFPSAVGRLSTVIFERNQPSQPLPRQRYLLRSLLWALCILFVPLAVFGQENGKVAVNVTDPQGNPVSDAKVSLSLRGSSKEFHGPTI